MASVSGRVVGRVSGQGIANLVVEVFDVPQPSNTISRKTRSAEQNSDRRRLGSSITKGTEGHFSVDYDVPAPGSKNRARSEVNLLLTVSLPEGNDHTAPLYVSRGIRARAAPKESYLISVSEEAIEKAGGIPAANPASGAAEPIGAVAERFIAASRRKLEIARAEKKAFQLEVDDARSATLKFRNEYQPIFERRLSGVSEELAKSETFVPSGASITERYKSIVDKDLKDTINPLGKKGGVRTKVALTNEQLAKLRDKLDANLSISAQDFQAVLGRNDQMSGAEFLRRDAAVALCRKMTKQERDVAVALDAVEEDETPEDDESEYSDEATDLAGNGVEVVETGDLPRYLARLIDTMTSPEEAVLTGLEPRATQGTLATQMQGLALKPSPADTTAYYEFHNLQVAFRHVWQEAVDEGIISLAEAAYDEIVLGGGAPKFTATANPFHVLVNEGKAVARALDKGGNATPNTARGYFSHITSLIDNLLTPPSQVFEAVRPEPLPALLNELSQRLQEPYVFTTFAANRQERSVNFGIRVSYQQEWQPLEYQAGRLAGTITLAPKEVRRYTKTVKRHRKRAEKELEKNVTIRKDEMTQTSRLEQDVIRKANTKTHFQLSSEMTGGPPGGPVESTTKTSFDREASQTSEAVKKSFNEAVRRSALEVSNEFLVEINKEESEDFEEIEAGELSNPNLELSVAFLFYELQRRYRISERLHRLTPIVLVAQEMPKPHEINEAWLISHDWILRRVLLDDSFASALTYLSTQIVGDQVALTEMRTNIAQQRQIIAELKQQLTVVRQRVATYRNLMEKALLNSAKRDNDDGGIFSGIPIVGGAVELVDDAIEAVGDFINPDMAGVGDSRQDTMKEIIQRTVDEERDLLMRLEREVTALNALTETYSKALAENYNQRTQILRLRTHIKQNILYYMQAIWNHESPDQRYLRLHETPVPVFSGGRRYRFADLSPISDSMSNLAHRRLGVDGADLVQIYEAQIHCDLNVRKTQPLAQVANLDELIGYFGNCMIFALKESNPLTDFMMEPYVVQGFNELTDPDDLANWSLQEFIDYVLCLKKKLTADQFEKVKPELRKQYDRLAKAGRRNGDVITLPTGSLFIEALPATTSLIERFTAMHRAIDVKKIQAETRQVEIENLRMVDRLLNGERDDPEIEKKVMIQGVSAGPTIPVDDPG